MAGYTLSGGIGEGSLYCHGDRRVEVEFQSNRDSRLGFVYVTESYAADLPDIEIELSILSKPEETDDPLSLKLGTHGILIENPAGRGCFLPQVAAEFGWSKEEFLTRCCSEKASLPAEAWKQPETRVRLFTVELISER